jgi:hypothetical protein
MFEIAESKLVHEKLLERRMSIFLKKGKIPKKRGWKKNETYY